MRMLDLFCGRGGWTNAFLERGWEVHGIDLLRHADYRGEFFKADVMDIVIPPRTYDFICASSPCEQFSVHGMKCFHANPPYPELGIELFNHTQSICEESKIPFVMENVRSAEKFVGKAVSHCGPFYLWGNAVPPLLNQGIKKGNTFRGAPGNWMSSCPPGQDRKAWRMLWQKDVERRAGGRRHVSNFAATIPPELANCVADYAERILELAAK